jgi:sporulation protein YlmC with PRC-barrel domain
MTVQRLQQMRGAEVISRTGDEIGELGEIYCDTETENPEWISIPTGIFTTKRLLVPASHVELQDDKVVVPFSAQEVKDSPRIVDDELDEETERSLYEYYDLDYSVRGARRRGPARVWFKTVAGEHLRA